MHCRVDPNWLPLTNLVVVTGSDPLPHPVATTALLGGQIFTYQTLVVGQCSSSTSLPLIKSLLARAAVQSEILSSGQTALVLHRLPIS